MAYTINTAVQGFAIRQKILQTDSIFVLPITRWNLRHNYATNFLCPNSTFFIGIAQNGVYWMIGKIMIQKIPRENPRDTVVIINNDALQQ